MPLDEAGTATPLPYEQCRCPRSRQPETVSAPATARSAREPSEPLPQPVVEARPGHLRQDPVLLAELDVDVLPRPQLARRAAVHVDLDGLLPRRVVDRQQVLGSHDQ